MKVFKDLLVPIYNSDGMAYTDTGSNKVILIYAKILAADSGESNPYDWWEEDNHGGANALVGGSVAAAQLSHIDNGIWKIRIESDVLDAENPDREDQYFVKIGTSISYGGWNDANWTLVDGYDPVTFSTINLTPKVILGILDKLSDFLAINWTHMNALLDGSGDIVSGKEGNIDVKDLLDSQSKFITELSLLAKTIDGSNTSNAYLADLSGRIAANSRAAAMIAANMSSSDQFPVYLPVTSGTGSPSTTPSRVCQLYLDTDTNEIWTAVGVDSASDWRKTFTSVHTDNITNPPTDAELDGIFGLPPDVGAGFTAYIDDNGAGTNFYHIVSDGTSWFYEAFTKAT